MSDAMRDQLERAYNLIQQEQLDDAVNLLRPVVARDPDNPDAWWLLANAVSDPHDAYSALTNVLRLEPHHDQARELLDNLLQEFPELGSATDTTADMFSPDTSEMRSTQTTSTNWDAEFGVGMGQLDADASTPDIDDLFSNYDASLSDIDALTEDDPLVTTNPTNVVTEEYELDTYFKADSDDAEDLDAMFKSDVKNAPTTRTESSDLDALFGVRSESPAAGADAFNDPFGANDPDFLDDVVVPSEVTATTTLEDKRRTRTGKTTTRPAGAVPKGDPFAPAISSRRRPAWLPFVIALVLIGAIAVLAWIALFRPFGTQSPTSTEVASNTGTTDPTSQATGESSLSALDSALGTTAERLVSANFSNPLVSLSDGVFVVETCEKPSRNLRSRFNEVIAVVAQEAAKVRDQVKTAQVKLTNCADPAALLYSASAPIDALISYVDGGLADVAAYRAAWTAN